MHFFVVVQGEFGEKSQGCKKFGFRIYQLLSMRDVPTRPGFSIYSAISNESIILTSLNSRICNFFFFFQCLLMLFLPYLLNAFCFKAYTFFQLNANKDHTKSQFFIKCCINAKLDQSSGVSFDLITTNAKCILEEIENRI